MLGFYPLSTWNTTVNATINTNHNTWSFSQRLLLVLTYSLFSFIRLPLIILGYISLRGNGVAALSDSFLQLLITITRSDELDRIARSSSIGGADTATKELKNTRIMYGALATERKDGEGLGRMGFGLEKHMLYSNTGQKQQH